MPITINGTTGISGVDGSTGTPALIGSDADTGFVFAVGQVSASLNGTAANVPLVQGTAQNSTSGTSIDFTGIPSWAKRVTVVANGISTNGSSLIQVQVGSGSFSTSSYVSGSSLSGGGVGQAGYSSTTGLLFDAGAPTAAGVRYGSMVLTNVSGNIWVANFTSALNLSGTYYMQGGGGVSPTLGGALDRVRITTVNGTDTFDAGSINILYE